MTSIRRGMLFFLLSAFAFVWALTSVLVIKNVRDQVSGAMDDQIRQAAYFTWTRAAHSKENNFQDLDALKAYMEKSFGDVDAFAYQVWEGERLLSRSDNAPETRMSTRPGFKLGALQGEPWRFFYRVDAFEGLDVVFAVRDQFSGDVAKAIAWSVTWPLAFAVFAIGVISFWGVTWGLHPLHRLAEQIDARTPSAMDPIDERKVPQEVRTLVRALNELLRRLHSAMEAERRFNANASHELRTPLAAIEVQSSVALGAKNEDERVRALEEIRHNVDRGRRLIEQLLSISRLDPDRASKEFAPINLFDVVADALREIQPMASERQVELSLDGPEAAQISADAYGLSILVRNVIDNAVRYTRDHGFVAARIEPDGDFVRLTIEDNGPGIAAEELERVFDRFYRVVGTPSTGSGLGLSIVSRIAELHRAQLSLENRVGGGLIVRIAFPADQSSGA